jgi:hypothetical protein
VRHSSLVTKEGSEVAWFRFVILGERLHCKSMKIQINMSSKMIAKGTKQHNRNTSSIKQDDIMQNKRITGGYGSTGYKMT